AHAPDRQRVGGIVGRVLFAKAAAPHRLEERGAKLRPAPQHLVVHGGRAAQLAQAPRFRLADTEQRDDIAAVGVKPQKLGGQRAARRTAAGNPPPSSLPSAGRERAPREVRHRFRRAATATAGVASAWTSPCHARATRRRRRSAGSQAWSIPLLSPPSFIRPN